MAQGQINSFCIRIFFSVLVVFLLCGKTQAQIVNIEDERIKTDTSGWGGKAKLSLSYQKTDVDFFKSDVYAHIQFKTAKSLYLLLLKEHSLSKGDGKEFANASTQHLRYNYKITRLLTAEAFVQGQFNKVLHVGFRFLTGAGPRLSLITTNTFRLYAGCLYMYEIESLTDNSLNYNHRLSNYISLTLKPNNIIRLVHTTYYQPRIDCFDDFRLFSQSSLKVAVSKRFSLSFDYKLYYDSQPPEGIVRATHNFLNGIEFVF